MFKLNKKSALFLFVTAAASFVAGRIPYISSPYSFSSLSDRLSEIFKPIKGISSENLCVIEKKQLKAVVNLAAQESKEQTTSRVSSEVVARSSWDGGFDYKLVKIMEAIDDLFSSSKALCNKASAERIAEFINQYAKNAASKTSSISGLDQKVHSFTTDLFNTFYQGLSWGIWGASNGDIEDLKWALIDEIDAKAKESSIGYSSAPISSSNYSYQSPASSQTIDRGKTGASASELIGVHDNNNICPICKHSFEWGPMTAPFACKSKVHLAHPRCISGITKCPVYGCGAGLGSVCSSLQEECVICCETLFGNYKEVNAMFSCAQTNRPSTTKTHLLHEECAKNLFKSNGSAKCPECRASQGSSIRKSPLI